MYDLTLIQHDGGVYVDSREVAVAIEKRHDHLLRDIKGYLKVLENFNHPKVGGVDFFLASTYADAKGETRPCFLLSKMGCEMVANKLTGEKGVLFTASYVAKFNLMEQEQLSKREAALESLILKLSRLPRLGEVNACSRLIVMGMKSLGATPEQVMSFLKETYEPFGMAFTPVDYDEQKALRWYNANGIAKECGMFSLNGKPHGQAAAGILKEVLYIGEEHMRCEKDHYGLQVGISTLYDDYALLALLEWVYENGCPEDIEVEGRTYRVQYRF